MIVTALIFMKHMLTRRRFVKSYYTEFNENSTSGLVVLTGSKADERTDVFSIQGVLFTS